DACLPTRALRHLVPRELCAFGGWIAPVRRRASAWIVVAAAVLAGCAIGPDYTRPAVANPDRFRGQAAVEAASLADAPWWEVFQDPILRDLIHEALRNNYDVSIAADSPTERRSRPVSFPPGGVHYSSRQGRQGLHLQRVAVEDH